jgi:LPS sulfotransferase NodH
MTRIGLGKPNEYFMPWITRDDLNWQDELASMMEKQTENGLFAVKIMANQIRRIDQKLADNFAPVDDGPFPHFRAALPEASWIFIQRKDKIDQAISHFLAKGSGVYHTIKTSTGFVPGSAVHENAPKDRLADVPYDFSKILAEWHTLQTGDLLWQEFFRATGIDPLCIEYSTYSRDLLFQVGKQLGITMKKPEGEANLTKMANARNLKIKKRFTADLFSRL